MKTTSEFMRIIGGIILLLQVIITPLNQRNIDYKAEVQRKEIVNAIGDIIILQYVQLQPGDAKNKAEKAVPLFKKYLAVQLPEESKISWQTWFFVLGAALIGAGQILDVIAGRRSK